jgi:3-dehydroquinate synthase
MTTSVPVSLGERSYHIHIGEKLLHSAGALLTPHVGSSAVRRVPVITDETVNELYYPAFAESLSAAGLFPIPVVLPPGEQTKSFSQLERVVDSLLSAHVERGSLIVALGGGVIGDLAGFAAGVVKRGIGFAQVPTTLLAQVDSSVGGKTAINTTHGKNLVGVFHQPRVVIADTAVLKTLPRRELLGGYAEVVKYGLLGDESFFSWLEKNGPHALAGDTHAIAHAVAHSCVMKASIVAKDEREEGERALLNLGHTFGHALEAATGYSDRLLHGESVALGCVLALKLSAMLGHAREADVTRTERHLAAVGLPTRVAQIPGPRPKPNDLLAHMRHDKKAQDGRMTFILVKGIGHAFITRDVPEDTVRTVLGQD